MLNVITCCFPCLRESIILDFFQGYFAIQDILLQISLIPQDRLHLLITGVGTLCKVEWN